MQVSHAETTSTGLLYSIHWSYTGQEQRSEVSKSLGRDLDFESVSKLWFFSPKDLVLPVHMCTSLHAETTWIVILRELMSPCACRTIDAFEPAIQLDNGTVTESATSFFNIDSTSIATGMPPDASF